MQNNINYRIAVLVNEFGEIGVDGEILKNCQICEDDENPEDNIIELRNGCLCCTVQEEFYPNIEKLYERINDNIPNKFKSEIIFINDGSTDLSEEIIRKISLADKNVCLISFTKNIWVSSNPKFSLGSA